MAITVPVVFDDKVSAPAEKAASAVDDLADAFEEVNAAADSAGTAGKTAVDKVNKASEKAAKKQTKATKKTSKEFKGVQQELGALAKKFPKVTAAIAVGFAIKKTAEWAAEITKGRRQLKNMIDVLTGGQGERVFAGLTKLAKGLNLPVEQVAQSFAAFKKAGLTEKVSVQMIKLKADIEALIGPGEQANEAVGKAMDRIKAGEDASKVIAEIGKEMGVVGDGSKAAAVKVGTLDGKIAQLGLAWDAAKVAIAEPVADFMLWFIDGFDDIGTAIPLMIDDIGEFFMGIDAALSGAMASIRGWITDTVSAIGALPGQLVATVAGWISAGADMISGLVDGALSIDLIGAITDMAAGALDAIKSTLGIGSPSKLFAEVGVNVGKGFVSGVEATPTPMLPMPAPPLAATGGAAGGPVTITMIISGEGGPEDTARAVRREIATFFNQAAMSGG